MQGSIFQLNVKAKTPASRGLPKSSVEFAKITKEGLEGDFNVYRHEKLADDPDSAVLLIPMETLEQLRDEGWPIKPGELGENITTRGISYNDFALGKTIALGEARVQISRACTPCRNLDLLPYVGTERGPVFRNVLLGRRGWYARVVKEGLVRRGDPITLVG